MHCKKMLSAAVAASALLLLAGCEKDVESRDTRMSVYPSMGKVLDAKVRIYAADGKELVGKGLTGDKGKIGIGINYDKAAVIRVLAVQETTYFDESLGTFINLPAGQTMHALVTAPRGDVAVTPLTDIAYRIAVQENLFPLSAYEVETLNERVRQALAPELDSILLPPTILEAMPVCTADPLTNTCLTDSQADRYALRLAALARLGDGEVRPVLSVMQALGRDVLDGDGDGFGVIDGLDRNGDSVGAPYDTGTLVDDVNNLLAELALNHGDAALQDAVAGYPDIQLNLDLVNIDDGSNFTGCGAGDSTLPDDFKGQSFNMSFEQADVGSPYLEGDVVRFSFCSNGELRLTNDYYVVASGYTETPVDAIQTNYSWQKASNNIVYQVVSMSGTLYEVNVFGENGSIYYGRFIR